MCFISLNKEENRLFLMYCLSVYLILIQSYRAFSKTAADHWCLSLIKHLAREANISMAIITDFSAVAVTSALLFM